LIRRHDVPHAMRDIMVIINKRGNYKKLSLILLMVTEIANDGDYVSFL